MLSLKQLSYLRKKQGLQGPQKLSFLKPFKIKNPPPMPGIFTYAMIVEMASLSISGRPNRKERPNLPTNNGDTVEKVNVRE